MSKMPKGSTPSRNTSQASDTQFSSNAFLKEILSKLIRLLLFLIQICSFRKAKGWSYRIDKAICTVRNRPKSSRISRSNEDAKREALSRYPPIMGSSLLQRALPGAGQDAHTGNLLCSLARLSYLGAGRLSKAFARSLRTNPRQKRQWLC